MKAARPASLPLAAGVTAAFFSCSCIAFRHSQTKTARTSHHQNILPQYDVDGLQPGGDVCFGNLWGVRLQHVWLGGFNVGNRCCQTLPQAEEIVHAVRSKLPVLPKGRKVDAIGLPVKPSYSEEEACSSHLQVKRPVLAPENVYSKGWCPKGSRAFPCPSKFKRLPMVKKQEPGGLK